MSATERIAAYLAPRARELRVTAGEAVVRRGEPRAGWYFVLEGTFDVRIVAAGGETLSLRRIVPGQGFGEISLLRGEPGSTDVVALAPARVLELPAALFPAALAESEELRMSVLRWLADDLRRTAKDALALYRRGEALKGLAFETRPAGEVVAVSRRMQAVVRHLETLAALAEPVLVRGEAGTGKLFAARTLHELSKGSGSPLLVVDAAALSSDDAERLLSRDAADALLLASGGTLVIRHVEALDARGQTTLLDALAPRAGAAPPARVVATTSADLKELARTGRFDHALAALLTRRDLAMPRLLERRQDVVPLARLFLAERGAAAALGRDGERALLAARFGHRNAAELRDTVETAAVFAGTNEIGSEHVFSGPRDDSSVASIELWRVALVTRLSRGRAMSVARAVVAAGFAALVVLCLAVPARRAGRLANAAVWGLWEPGLVVVFLALGRVWCGVCPIASAGALAARVKSFAHAPAAWMKKGRVVLAVAALAFIFWVERVFHMLERPRATGVFLAALAVLAVGFSVVWARATWCRYVCPLGALGSAFAVAAPLEVRAAQGICATQCTTHDCYKACPVFHHPMYTNESHVCTLCLRCIRVCPNGSAGLFARAPFQSLWRLPSLDPTLSALALALALVALVVLASLDPFWSRHPTAFTAAIVVAGAAGVLLGGRLGAIAGGDEPSAAPGPRAIAGIAILAWGPLMAYQLANVRFLGDVGITFGEGRISARAVLQSLATVAAAVASALLLWRTRRYFEKKGSAPDGAGWGLLHAVWSVYVAAAFVLTGAAASLP